MREIVGRGEGKGNVGSGCTYHTMRSVPNEVRVALYAPYSILTYNLAYEGMILEIDVETS